jgi:hypothetical protein
VPPLLLLEIQEIADDEPALTNVINAAWLLASKCQRLLV